MFTDTHCHLLIKDYEDIDFIIRNALEKNIKKVINNGTDLKSNEEVLKLSEIYENVYPAIGFHPDSLNEFKKENLRIIDENKDKIVAIGEIGLDYYWNKENKELQKYAFIEQIKIANANNLPIQIHTREAVNDTLEILKNVEKPQNGAIFHCCPLNRELVKEGLKLGIYISLSGTITFKNSKNADEIIKMIPLEKMLIETDSPYLSPEPNRGKRNDSRNLKYIVEKIANVKEMTPEEIAKTTYNNAEKIFNIQ